MKNLCIRKSTRSAGLLVSKWSGFMMATISQSANTSNNFRTNVDTLAKFVTSNYRNTQPRYITQMALSKYSLNTNRTMISNLTG